MEKEKRIKKKRNLKNFKYGTVATVITVIVVAVVVLVNIIMSAISNQYSMKLDLTSSKLYEISDDTLDYVGNITEDVEIACTYKESEMQTNDNMKMIYEVLQKYKQASDHISLIFFDTTEDPDILSSYQSNYNGTISEGDIIVKCGEQIRTVKMSDMFEVDDTMLQYYYYGYVSYSDCITGFAGEQLMTSAIMYVTDSDPKKVGIITMSNSETIYSSQNKYSVQSLETLFTNNGYDIEEIDVATTTITADAYDVIVLPAPQNDLTQDTISQLTDFLYNNGDYSKQLLYFADYTQSETPNIDEFLELWGIEINDSIVRDSDDSKNQQVSITLGTAGFPVASIADETYSEGLSNTSLPIVAPLCKSINLLWESNNERSTTSLLKTSSTSYDYPLSAISSSSDEDSTEETEATTEFDVDSAEKSEKIVMAAGKRSTTVGQVINTSTVFVAGSMSLIDYYISEQSSSYNNAEFIINAINTETGKGDGITIASKSLSSSSISISNLQASIVRHSVVIGIPVIVIIIGIVVFIRRRRK